MLQYLSDPMSRYHSMRQLLHWVFLQYHRYPQKRKPGEGRPSSVHQMIFIPTRVWLTGIKKFQAIISHNVCDPVRKYPELQPFHTTREIRPYNVGKRETGRKVQSSGIVSSWETSSQIRVRAWMGMLGSLDISSIFDIASAARSPMAFELFVSSVRVSSATRRIFLGIEPSSWMCCSIRIQFS